MDSKPLTAYQQANKLAAMQLEPLRKYVEKIKQAKGQITTGQKAQQAKDRTTIEKPSQSN